MENEICWVGPWNIEIALYFRPYEFSNHQLGITCDHSFPWEGGGSGYEKAGNREIEHDVYFPRKLNESFTKIGRNFADSNVISKQRKFKEAKYCRISQYKEKQLVIDG